MGVSAGGERSAGGENWSEGSGKAGNRSEQGNATESLFKQQPTLASRLRCEFFATRQGKK